jgi:hypothetical protein
MKTLLPALAFLVVVGRLLVNVALTVDMIGNIVLLGRPGETISRRCSRLRTYGGPRSRPVGCVLCWCLTRMFWFMRRDHCDWAADPTDQMTSGWELWRWSK